MQSFTKTILHLTLICVTIISEAQDIIIKNDKTELKSKVMEITDTHIKYKRWDNIDGPIYNLIKTEVFMILYANGQREIIEHTVLPASSQAQRNTIPIRTTQQTELNEKASSTGSLNQIQTDLRKERADYRPTRIVVGMQSPFEIGIDTEFRLIRNFLNIGVTYNHAFPKDDDIISASFGSLYASAYLPLNRLLKNYEDQSKGLFIFCNAGLAYNKTDIYNPKTFKSDPYYSDFYMAVLTGFDYYFTKGFGLSVSSYGFKSFYIGITGKI